MRFDDLIPLAISRTRDVPDQQGLLFNSLNGLHYVRANGPTGYSHSIYSPLICIVLQGTKEVVAGAQPLRFEAGQLLLISADLPIQGRVVNACGSHPYLSLAVDLDLALLRDVMGEMAAAAEPAEAPAPRIVVSEPDAEIADCFRRLARLPERPDAHTILRPAILRELHYWLLQGRYGTMVRQLARPESQAQRIGRAVAVLRADFAQRLPVRRLAETAGMSASAFHQHFKATTTLTPLQFQKQLRLIEARRLILSGTCAVSVAAFEVGYESVSQFSRDYARMFGASPRRDLTICREAA